MDGLNELAKQINETAKSKGWWDDKYADAQAVYRGETVEATARIPRNVGEVLMLIVSEASEAMEAYREGLDLRRMFYVHPDGTTCDPEKRCLAANGVSDPAKPEGIPIELADVIIRTLDACAEWGIDIETAMRYKMAYNRTRPNRHGGKLA